MTDRRSETTQGSISTDPAPMFDLWSKSVEPACGSWQSVQDYEGRRFDAETYTTHQRESFEPI
jgi:hypothetical protein